MMRHTQRSDVGGPMQFGPLPPGSEEIIRPLFKEVFGDEISSAMLSWKYGAGRGESWVGLDHEEQVQIHCGLFFRQTFVGGRQQKVAQLVDLMASPRTHGGISRKRSPFYLLIRSLLETVATVDNLGAWAFGFPSARAMRLGEHLGVFRMIDQMYELTFAPQPPGYRGYRCNRLAELSGDNGRTLQRLWEQMAADLQAGIVGIRDPEYLRWRYLQHPEKQYELYLVQSPWVRRPIGGLVMHREGKVVELMEIIAPLRHISRIVQTAREWLYNNTGQQLKLWLASNHIGLLADQAASVEPLEFRIMANPMTPIEELQRFDRRWWLTSGDTDYR